MAEPVETEEVLVGEIQVILDAGHGGRDPGKVGINGEIEKDINLKIVNKVREKLENQGIIVALTRENDARKNEKGEEYSKSEDMKKGVEMINEVKPEIVVSIHQNSYTSEDIKGAQVFYYAGSEEGRKMAQILQESVRMVDSENDREIKSNDTYYLLTKTAVPTLIVECGFLTNPEEAKKLTEDWYQEEVSNAIADGIMKCLNKNKIAASSI